MRRAAPPSNDALEIAGRNPVAARGHVEVRPVASEVIDAVDAKAGDHQHQAACTLRRTTARNKAIDRIRRERVLADKQRTMLADLGAMTPSNDTSAIPDERLRLILRRLERTGEAREAYERAADLATDEAERRFLARLLAGLAARG